MYPNNTANQNERHSRHGHHTVVYVAEVVAGIGNNLEAQQSATAQELANSTYDNQNKPWPSFLDGVGNGLGYAMILVIVGAVREILGRGSLLGFQIIPDACYDFGYVNNGMMTMPAMALILVGCVIWVHRAYFYKEK